MPFYKKLSADTETGRRTIERLLDLRKDLDRQIPATKNMDGSLLLATWNIREFDSEKYGDRIEEAFYYLAEIIARFDLVAIQEVREDLQAMDHLIVLLGPHWKYLFTDVTEGSAGNGERMAFLYDTRKVQHGGLSGELVLPPIKTKDANGHLLEKDVRQIARTPFLCGFRAGWTDFILTTVHIYYGEDAPNDPARVAEIRQTAQYLAKRTAEPRAWSKNWILLGDFNIYSPADSTMKAITEAGFTVPPELQQLPSNIAQDKFYDQIAFRVRPDRFATTAKAGVYNFFKIVFRDEDEVSYASLMGPGYTTNKQGIARGANQCRRYYRDWRTFQMSDHLPMWVELRIDYSDEYLERKLSEAAQPALPSQPAPEKPS